MNQNHNDKELIETNIDFFATTTTIKPSVSLPRLMEILRLRKTNGDLCIHLNKGGVRRIELSERKALSEKKADQFREILNMELDTDEENL